MEKLSIEALFEASQILENGQLHSDDSAKIIAYVRELEVVASEAVKRADIADLASRRVLSGFEAWKKKHLCIPIETVVSDFSGIPEKHGEYMEDLGGHEFVHLVNINNYCTEDSNKNGDICLAWSELNFKNVLNDAWKNETECRVLVVKNTQSNTQNI
jgi:hypothetical protein